MLTGGAGHTSSDERSDVHLSHNRDPILGRGEGQLASGDGVLADVRSQAVANDEDPQPCEGSPPRVAE